MKARGRRLSGRVAGAFTTGGVAGRAVAGAVGWVPTAVAQRAEKQGAGGAAGYEEVEQDEMRGEDAMYARCWAAGGES